MRATGASPSSRLEAIKTDCKLDPGDPRSGPGAVSAARGNCCRSSYWVFHRLPKICHTGKIGNINILGSAVEGRIPHRVVRLPAGLDLEAVGGQGASRCVRKNGWISHANSTGKAYCNELCKSPFSVSSPITSSSL